MNRWMNSYPPPPPPREFSPMTRAYGSLRRLSALALALAALALSIALLAAFLAPSAAFAQAPGGVGEITLTRSDGTVTASWDAVSGATHYHVTYTTDGGSSWHAPVDNHRNLPDNTLTFNADNAKTYIVGVRAGNAQGWSGWRNSPSSGPYIPPTPTPTPEPTPTPTPTPEPTPTPTPTPTPDPDPDPHA